MLLSSHHPKLNSLRQCDSLDSILGVTPAYTLRQDRSPDWSSNCVQEHRTMHSDGHNACTCSVMVKCNEQAIQCQQPCGLYGLWSIHQAAQPSLELTHACQHMLWLCQHAESVQWHWQKGVTTRRICNLPKKHGNMASAVG